MMVGVGGMYVSTVSLNARVKTNFLATDRWNRTTIEIVNNGGSIVYLGGNDVSETKGVPIKVGESKMLPVNSGAALMLYLFAPTSTTVVVAEYLS